jgi:glycerol-3-phosphate dehydrogenase
MHHLVARYGTLAFELAELIAADPALSAPIAGADEYLAAEVSYAVAQEGALHVDDVLTRRTHIAFEVPDRGELAAVDVARLMAPVLGWDQAVIDREIVHYRARLEAEAAAQALLTDAASDSVRGEVRDPRLEHFGGHRNGAQ